MNAKLLDERPLLVIPSLAKSVGLNEAIVLQQLHFYLQRDDVVVQGDVRRIQMKAEAWREQFPWWSEATIRRIFQSLRETGMVLTERGSYGIDYLRLTDHIERSSDHIERSSDQIDRPYVREREREVERTSATEAVAEAEQQLFESPTSPAQADESDDAIASIWTEYLTVFGDRVRVKELTDRRRTMIRKALKAVAGDAELCKRAIHGLKSYRASHPEGSNRVDLGVIFETNMRDSKNLTDKIEGWAELADRTIPGTASTSTVPLDLAGVPSVTKGTIQARRREVAQMYDHPESPDARKRGEAAVDWLKENVGHAPNIVDGQLKGWRFA